MKKIGLILLLRITFFNLYASEGFAILSSEKTLSSSSLKPVIFSATHEKEWVEQCIKQYPEILYLVDEQVRKTEEGQATAQGSYSEQLFNQKYIEFDRTVMTLHCLKLILDGSDNAYQEFSMAQPKDARLSRESFHDLHLQGERLLKSKWGGMTELQIAQAMETALVLGDIGSRVLEMHKARLAKGDGDSTIPLNFNKVAGIAKTSPELLQNEYTIDAEGNVRLVGE